LKKRTYRCYVQHIDVNSKLILDGTHINNLSPNNRVNADRKTTLPYNKKIRDKPVKEKQKFVKFARFVIKMKGGDSFIAFKGIFTQYGRS